MIYLKLSNINGSVTEKNHANWILVDGYYFKVSRKVYMPLGIGSSREKGIPSFSQLQIVKPSDQSSIALFEKAVNGQTIDQLQIDVCHTGDSFQVHSQYTLHNVLVSHYEDNNNGQGESKEFICFHYTKIERKYIPHNEMGHAGSPLITGFDLTKAVQA